MFGLMIERERRHSATHEVGNHWQTDPFGVLAAKDTLLKWWLCVMIREYLSVHSERGLYGSHYSFN